MPNVDWTNKNTLQNLINTIHARLITKIAHYAVMPTANNKLLGEIAQYIGTTDANFVNAYFYKCYEVVDEDTGAVSYSWKPVDVQASTAISAENDNALVELSDGFYVKAVQMTALPVATADNLGVIYQYVGTTNVSFINGYFYKNEAVTDETTGDVTYEWHNVKTQDATAISEVVDNAIVDLADGIYVKAVQLVTLPEATVDNVGVIYQYIGNSTATLTNGYFYKNIATTDEDTGETTYAWTAFATQEEAVKHWIGTRAELEVALENDEIEDGTVILITDEPEIDELPTEDSTNLVYSGGVWTALQEKENVFRYTTMPTAGEELEGEIVEYIGATTLDYTNGYFYKCVSDGGDPAVYSWENIPVQDMGEKIQYEVLPTPTADNLGQIAEYIGATNAEYTNGFFYEVAEVAESDPAEYEWVQKNVQPEGLKASGHPVNNTSDRPDWHSGVADENWEGYFSKPTVDVVAISESEVGEYDTGYVYVVEDPTLSTHSTFVWEIVYISNGDIRKYYKSTNLVTVNKVSITQELYNAIPAAKLDVDWTWWVTDTNTVYYRGKTFSGLRASGHPVNNIEDKPDWHSGIAEESWEGYYSKPTIDATAVLSTELDSHKGEYVYVVKEPTDTDLSTLWWEIVYISGNESYQPGNKYKCTSLAKVNKVLITKELYDMIPGEKLDVDWTWWITDKSTIMLDGVEYSGDTIQVVSLPTATADNLGKIVQYIGENDTVNNLVKGFFYRCVEVPDTDPTEYEWVHQNVDDGGSDTIQDVSELPTSSIENIIYRLDNLLEYNIDYTAETISWADANEYLQSFSDFLTENNIEHTTIYYDDTTHHAPTARIPNPEIFLRTENSAVKDKPLKEIVFYADTVFEYTLIVKTFDDTTVDFTDKKIFTIYKGTNNTLYAGSEKNQTIERLANYEDIPDISKIPNVFTGTQEEWDALTENEKVEYDIANITDDNSGLEMPTEVYSTTETKTNKVWIDGKPIYRKVLTDLSITISNETWTNLCSATVFPNAQIITGGTLIDNGNRIINSNEMLFDNGYLRTEIMTGGSRTIKTVILEYTKTTD